MFLANSGALDEISLIFFRSGKKVTVFVALLIAAFAYLLLIPLEHEQEFENKDAFWEWYTANIKGIYLTSYGIKQDGRVHCKYHKIKQEDYYTIKEDK